MGYIGVNVVDHTSDLMRALTGVVIEGLSGGLEDLFPLT